MIPQLPWHLVGVDDVVVLDVDVDNDNDVVHDDDGDDGVVGHGQ